MAKVHPKPTSFFHLSNCVEDEEMCVREGGLAASQYKNRKGGQYIQLLILGVSGHWATLGFIWGSPGESLGRAWPSLKREAITGESWAVVG